MADTPDVSQSALTDMNEFDQRDWVGLGNTDRYMFLSTAEMDAVLATETPALALLRERIAKHRNLTPHDRDVIMLARRQCHQDGELEIDANAIVSEGDDNGAYVMGWAWTSFADTPLDKDAPEEDEDEEGDVSSPSP